MKLPVDVIIESLSDLVIDSVFSEKEKFQFTGVRVFIGDEEELADNILYVCAPRVLYESDRSRFEGHSFVIKACPFDYQPSNAIILGEQCNLRLVMNRLIALFERVNEFEQQLKEAAVVRQGYEPFFDAAKRMLPDCLLVMTNSSYNLICSTKDTVTENAYINNILQRGCYSKKDLDLMASRGYFEDERKYRMPILYEAAHTISGVPFLVRSYRKNAGTLSFVGCYFMKNAPTQLALTLFRRLTDEVGRYMEANGVYDRDLPSSQQIIDDLIECKYKDQDMVDDRCDLLNIPSRGTFRVGLIQTEIDSLAKTAQMTNQLSAFCAVRNYGIFQYRSMILILFVDWHSYDVREKSVFEDNWQSLVGTLRANGAYMGVSLQFGNMSKLGFAYRQALNSATLGRRYDLNKRVYFYAKYYIYDLLENYRNVIPLDMVRTPYLDALQAEKNTTCNNLDLLYIYLVSERNIALTSRRVHMHRNGVLYRIQKILDALGLDLDSADVRLHLLISLKILEMQGEIVLKNFDEESDTRPISCTE